ncbi:MAG: RluA family pseudouridine synthase [Flavobacteriales bacterium]|nr:RluA family pseudouridine synthase [Flavobacteriales bacterium]
MSKPKEDTEYFENEEIEEFETHRFVIDKGQEPLRIDKYLMNRVENASRVKVKEAIDEGRIKVNGLSTKASYKVKPDDVILAISYQEPREAEIVPENLPIDIVYEDEALAIINKKPGMVVHPGYGNYTGTLVNALAWHFQQQVPSGELRPWLVHRIDKDTSGLLVVAKTEQALNHLALQFKEHTIDRVYHALVWGNLKEEKGTITGNIARSEKDRKMFRVYDDPEIGKPAVTHYKLLRDLTFVSYIECKLETGRTHQIRVHLKHLGHTLFNDSHYGGNKILKGVVFSKYKQFVENCFQIMPRQALHAKTLGFVHPVSGKYMHFDSELPDDFQEVLLKWTRVNETYDMNDRKN